MTDWKKNIESIASDFVENSPDNIISGEIAISPGLTGTKIFQQPLLCYGSAADPLFKRLKEKGVIGDHLMLPWEWLPGAETVISFFLPFTEEVRKSNRTDMSWPSEEWLHGYKEGQVFINNLGNVIKDKLIEAGYKSVVPSVDNRYLAKTGDHDKSAYKKYGAEVPAFSSNWSERHAAYICGMGTFGLSKGLITEKGIAGRFGSVITGLYIEPDERHYSGLYDYCTMCGACVRNCPAGAISPEKGKEHLSCSQFVNRVLEKHSPRYGCGKCQVGVPCESRIPAGKKIGF